MVASNTHTQAHVHVLADSSRERVWPTDANKYLFLLRGVGEGREV